LAKQTVPRGQQKRCLQKLTKDLKGVVQQERVEWKWCPSLHQKAVVRFRYLSKQMVPRGQYMWYLWKLTKDLKKKKAVAD